ncbi:hypothetical protein [Staphylococcus saccharolyticus]|uniref:hypothetical protein n=1 Tax=Staphylococcus saccharolyticus TaxID=33028 RepID=UPI00102DCC57|nr:hypothetical protein [Staphylococcus saccharolyticus]MBL7573956.1 hypothetical protein [Staphylococcus saccharolyticus]MBL7584959.1 hypothetical protein [Staphylococcus saccharolyticus]MBL7639568.1 hypothetical protein [Staphylococcus saccharolyticus]TAA91446.1 hypothetical protein DMB74_09335 [Staphylococcus saccharolyticus]TAA91557.1 hypothetical protein DMB77_09340 [Staphylococcus saccharolyticus]
MKKLIYTVAILVILACSCVVINFFFFDLWAIHSSEQQLNQYIQNHDTKQLHKIAKDKQTYHFFKTLKKVDFENATDNQAGGPIGYYRVDINKKPVGLTINIKYNFIPEKTTIKSIKLYQ